MGDVTDLLLSLSVLGPAAAFVLTVPTLLVLKNPSERWAARLVAVGFLLSAGAVLLGIYQVANTGRTVFLDVGPWFSAGDYEFEVRLVLDKLSLPFALMNALFCGLIGAFSWRYLHRERGFFRFMNQLALFGAAMQLLVLAGNVDLLFMGWEIVGLTSALLIAFFAERDKPVRHGLRAFVTYRLADIGLLAGAVWLHHSVGHGEMLEAGTSPFATFAPPQEYSHLVQVGLFLLLASMGKAALVPFSGWLPRAMEGPTPSSAIFYGALSIHAGPYLLLRASSMIEGSPVVAGAVITVGAATTLYATFAGRVQSDIKSALAFASLTQVGLIVVEIGLGFRYLALAHIIGHASVRTLQLLRAPSLLHDHHQLEKAVGSHLPRTGLHFERWVPARWQERLYVFSLERGFLDALTLDRVIGPIVRLLRRLDELEVALIRSVGSAPAAPNVSGQGKRPEGPFPEEGA